jgi:deazaflavin-dependent oxidoreductase (nitroreductase family)
MANTFRPNPFARVASTVVTALLRRGVKLGSTVLLTVPGRKSGIPRTTAVTILEQNGERWLQSPFGEVDWVRNLRASGQATLTRGRGVEAIAAIEVSPAEAAPVLQGTLASFPSPIRGYYDVTPDSPLAAFEREAQRHPMFRIVAALPTFP